MSGGLRIAGADELEARGFKEFNGFKSIANPALQAFHQIRSAHLFEIVEKPQPDVAALGVHLHRDLRYWSTPACGVHAISHQDVASGFRVLQCHGDEACLEVFFQSLSWQEAKLIGKFVLQADHVHEVFDRGEADFDFSHCANHRRNRRNSIKQRICPSSCIHAERRALLFVNLLVVVRLV